MTELEEETDEFKPEIVQVGRAALRVGARNMLSKALEDSHNVGFDLVEDSIAAIEGHFPPRYIQQLRRLAIAGATEWVQLFFAQFAVTCAVVADRLCDDGYGPRCVAEEVAFWFAVEDAKELVECEAEDGTRDRDEAEGTLDWLDDFQQSTLQDTDFLMLWNDALDGIENDPPPGLGMTSLRLEDWFTPFWPREQEPMPLLPKEA